MTIIKSVCVYCGSAPGHDPAYRRAAHSLGVQLAKAGVRLVYGGGSVGLMGETARSCLEAGGLVTGIIPQFLVEREVMLEALDDLIITDGMHERKRLMFEMSDGFVALPGGIGTLEETVEMLTWLQLGQHEKPVVLANVGGFWDPLIRLIGHMKTEGFIRPEYEVHYRAVTDAEEILPALYSAAEAIPEVDERAEAEAPSLSSL